jgi:hypothetical protein
MLGALKYMSEGSGCGEHLKLEGQIAPGAHIVRNQTLY